MKVYVGADHNGYHLKEELEKHLRGRGFDVVDDGNQKLDPKDDYPVFAAKAAKDVLSSDDKDARAILLCGSGQGMCMAANRHKGIRAVLGYDHESVRSARNDDDANVLCLAANDMPKPLAFTLAEAFLKTPFAEAERFKRRIRQMDE
jgi:ribose 5-phosphate isomerase B